MPNPTLRVLHAQVAVRPLYTCPECGAQAEGDAFTVEVNALEDVHTQQVSSQRIPVGWAGFWSKRGTKYLCPTCSTKTAA